ncbi:MAG: hypothetical protein JXK05_04045 [Campylobacterales bacterium]|nr:hypothetical protein [Campylobacterales bacterium]
MAKMVPQNNDKEIEVVAIEPLHVNGKTIRPGEATTLPEHTAKILAEKNKLKIKE